MVNNYMLTVFTHGFGHQDVQVNGADGIRSAITMAERVTGARVSHGRGGVLPLFDPAIIIDAETGKVERRHEALATVSTQIIVNPRAAEVRAALLSQQTEAIAT